MRTGSARRASRRHRGRPAPGAGPKPSGPRRRTRPGPPRASPAGTIAVPDLPAILAGPFAEFAFMRRALAGCLALSLGGAPVGVILMLRRMSLTGDAMAHAILPGAAV